MGSALSIGLTLGGLSAATSFIGAQNQASQQRAQLKGQAEAAKANAQLQRQQAELQKRQGQIEAENIDRQKSKIHRQFMEEQGRNRAVLAAGGVDPDSGSALDVALGNINLYSDDIGENAYQKALKEWETREQEKQALYQADVFDAQSSYLQRTANNLGSSLLTNALTSTLNGVQGFVSGYSMAGGSFGNSPSKLYWDRALNDWSTTMPRH